VRSWVHDSRFGKPGQPATDCALETWRAAGREEGTRAREDLRRGVEDALLALGQGFVAKPENAALRAALADGSLATKDYFNQLLRLVYRLIFLLTVEERGLLHSDGADDKAKALYAEGYGMKRLRERAVKRSAHDRFPDLWEAQKIVFRGLAAGEPRLALPALAGIFATTQCPALDSSRLENHAFLLAVFRLSWLREESGLARVNWRDMGPEELGSVYESLLELVPQVSGGRTFAFAAGGETKGNARKTTGSYYTPDSLVQVLLDSALEPVVESTIAAHPDKPVEALLELSVVDPACGSGHFLLAAARRMAAHVARLQAAGTPSAGQYRHALRQVVGRCIYGVDLNPMAVELCRVSLWMETVEPGRPLSFLDSHIQQGNSLLGATPELMEKGIPDAAWEPIEGDDKKTASALKKRNKKAAPGQRGMDSLWSRPDEDESAKVAAAVAEVDAAPDADVQSLAAKGQRWQQLLLSNSYQHQRLVADAWCAAFVWPKQPGPLADAAPTNEIWRQLRDGQGAPALTLKTTSELATQYCFFHWHLAFPQVFARGGFDVVLGNPPWERLTLRDQEWFASRDPEIAFSQNAADRRQKIQALATEHPDLLKEFQAEKRASLAEKAFSRGSGYFPLAGVGDVNTFALFAETAQRLLAPLGSTGLIVPSGIATTDTTKEFFASLVTGRKLRSIFDFDNRGGLFPAVQGNVRFCLLVTGGIDNARFQVAAQLTETRQLADHERVYDLTADDIRRINPGTLTCPLFPSRKDARIIGDIYQRLPVLEVEEGSATAGWQVALSRMLHMGDDAEHFRTEEQLAEAGGRCEGGRWVHPRDGVYSPLYESKLCDQYNHRGATFEGIPPQERFGTHPATRAIASSTLANPAVMPLPRYWAPEALASAWANGRRLLLAFRNAVSATADARCLNTCLMPVYPSGHSLNFITSDPAEDVVLLAAILNSFIVDFVFRQKATGGNASFFGSPNHVVGS
jgi:hypothetical protein